MNKDATYEAVIGLEVHAQLATQSKLFCGDPISFGASPNTQVSPISLGHPGTLPRMNEQVIASAIRLGLALNCRIEEHNYFARKNYFYPDLPKGYQVSQHTHPICTGGYVTIETTTAKRDIKLNRIHMEEDAGKSIHDIDPDYSCIDLNRAGIALLEIVTEPDLHSGEEAYTYLTELRRTLRWLGVCDGNMEEGSMRCDANISIRPMGSKVLGTRVEVKNLNSIRHVKKAIELEVSRLIQLTGSGKQIIQETRSYDAGNHTSFSLRSKEEADDYRYFPEPDVPPFHITQDYLENIKKSMPELPAEMQQRYQSQYGLSAYDAAQICSDREDAVFYEQLTRHTNAYKAAANWITGPLRSWCNEHQGSLKDLPLSIEALSEMIHLADTGKVGFNAASTKLLAAAIAAPGTGILELATTLNLLQESDDAALLDWVNTVMAEMPEKVAAYRAGKKNLLGLFAGEVKKRSKGKADMQKINTLLVEKLNNPI